MSIEKLQKAEWVNNGNAWQHPHKVKGALCEDGVRRTVRLNQQADTYGSWPGRTTIRGKTVRGFVTGVASWDVGDNPNLVEGDTLFIVYKGER